MPLEKTIIETLSREKNHIVKDALNKLLKFTRNAIKNNEGLAFIGE